ncbi:Shedu anti-phage system protein SduA domain-containing protein [Burkholderia ubonensis]|uniref:Shedu anti-phage system protein SduA domain-containing protein n=2 Tax=Burkholderia ubonensis TaxID=101571 RepID=UPI0008FDDBDC|nr:Shedu anti-phage system protein SduA domain-containing protein [Burkholderia ubonensis]
METIKDLVASGAGEHEIQAFIKTKCLHILGEACTPSSIAGEYIAFSQFQIMEGKTDFVVFTNRSRMEVVIIEIKGADFNFLNADGTINKNIHDAAQQVRNRFSHIQNGYETWRRRFHEIRRDVEAGKTIYSSFLGPAKHLEVDPGKEIWWKGMVIGGRSTEDHKESSIRNQLESESPRITYDTWDGWLKKNGHYGSTLRTNYPTGAD